MELSTFIKSLLTEGKVSIKGVLIDFTREDLMLTEKILEQAYQEDILDMPFTAPAFSREAALWAAGYFYLAVQLAVLRDEGEEEVREHLKTFPGEMCPESIYSADLVLRYLPALFDLARGLAPADLLVQEFRKAAVQWPFSSIGIELSEPVDEAIILYHPSLRQAYIDRIIQQKDKRRITNEAIMTCLRETIGKQATTIWPYFESALNH